jgi:hypothetical protein
MMMASDADFSRAGWLGGTFALRVFKRLFFFSFRHCRRIIELAADCRTLTFVADCQRRHVDTSLVVLDVVDTFTFALAAATAAGE